MADIILPLPKALDGAQLAKELAAAGLSEPEVSVGPDGLSIGSKDIASTVPENAQIQAALDAFAVEFRAKVDEKNAPIGALILEVVSKHVPVVPPPPPELTAEEKIAALGLTRDDLKALLA